MDEKIDAPKLKGWMIATEAATYLGVSKTTVQKMMRTGKFKTMWSVGNKPIYLLLTSEVDALKTQRAKTATITALRKLDKEQPQLGTVTHSTIDNASYRAIVELAPSQ